MPGRKPPGWFCRNGRSEARREQVLDQLCDKNADCPARGGFGLKAYLACRSRIIQTISMPGGMIAADVGEAARALTVVPLINSKRGPFWAETQGLYSTVIDNDDRAEASTFRRRHFPKR